MRTHVEAMLRLKDAGAITFDYGNNLRGGATQAGCADAFRIPGFVPEYIRPLFCLGKGPFRWVALSGDPADIARTDRLALELFPGDPYLATWMKLAGERIAFQGLPARICWLGLGERAKLGLAMNDLVRKGELKAPIVIGRDHLDTGSVASPYRETEAMKDGSDAIADWPVLNALLNTAAGATWVSLHHGGGVGIGYSLHAGQVVVADGTEAAARRLERVLTSDPRHGRRAPRGSGLRGRAGVREAPRGGPAGREVTMARKAIDLLVHDAAQVVTVDGGGSGPARGGVAMNDLRVVEAAASRSTAGRSSRRGPDRRDLAATFRARAAPRRGGVRVLPGFVDAHTHPVFARWRDDEFARRCRGETYAQILAAGGGILASAKVLQRTDVETLVAHLRRVFDHVLLHGTTTLEAKSGYGLTTEAEVTSLDALRLASRPGRR